MAGKILKFIFKWILIPCALGAIGYYFIGPQLLQTDAAPKPADTYTEQVAKELERKGDESSTLSQPTVEVEVTNAGGSGEDKQEPYTSRRRRRSDSGSQRSEPVDEGSVGGMREGR